MSRTSVVTGANRGLGFATARALAEAGDTVVIAARDEAAARTAAEKLNAEGHSARFVRLDVDSPASARAAAEQVGQWGDHIDVLVNNAGILPEATDAEQREFAGVELFEATFRTNVFGPVAVIEAFLPLLRASGAGRVVNVSSRMGSLTDHGDPESPYHGTAVPAYRSSKAALNSITVSLANQLAGTPVKVTSVCPGFVQTELTPGNKGQAPLTPEQAVAPILAAASLPAHAPSGTFIDREGPVAW
ncbi:SDR family oxidoreductase [Nocardiopsis ganjiahuensis]|uniref:SDR family oxidoreductase n=1 Tax=Nocardiopsis ganjiahuensis TaxID=239984 RepID=UPI000348C791|nr:SDR family oxidoreductase [Nocardiopsis ganjiahuensis]